MKTAKEQMTEIYQYFVEACKSEGVEPQELLQKLAEAYYSRFEEVTV